MCVDRALLDSTVYFRVALWRGSHAALAARFPSGEGLSGSAPRTRSTAAIGAMDPGRGVPERSPTRESRRASGEAPALQPSPFASGVASAAAATPARGGVGEWPMNFLKRLLARTTLAAPLSPETPPKLAMAACACASQERRGLRRLAGF